MNDNGAPGAHRFGPVGGDADFAFAVDDDGVATLRLARPDVLNAITLRIYAQLRDLFGALRYDERVKAIVLTGEGDAFCSGGDVHTIIGALLDADVKDHLEFCRMTGDTVRNMCLLDKPIISAVNGMAAGAGAVLALASDLRVASSTARFAFLFSKVGLTGADMGAAFLLPRIVGAGRAAELLYFGDTIDAATAERYGLVNRVVAPEEALPTALAWAKRLAQGPTLALGMTKRLLLNEANMDIVSALEAEAQAQALLMMADDHRRFYEAFRAKSRPVFGGR